jgi:hypothetical protein
VCPYEETAFKYIKENVVELLNKYAEGVAGLFYGLVERDLIRVYREYDEEQQRRREMSEEEAKDEADLIRQIEEEANRDAEAMAAFEHSKYYRAKE